MLDDGRYDAFIVWADARSDENGDEKFALELAITTGAHTGDVVDVLASRGAMRVGARDAIDLVGLPCTLFVEDGAPRVEA
jgi:hypothetical protein